MEENSLIEILNKIKQLENENKELRFCLQSLLSQKEYDLSCDKHGLYEK